MAYSGSRSQSSLSVCICQMGVITVSRFFGQRCSKMVSARCLSRCPALRAHLSRVSHCCVGVGKGGGRSVGSCLPASWGNCWVLCVTWALSLPPGSLPSKGHSDRAEEALLEGRARDPVALQPLAGSGQLPELLGAPAAAPGQGHAL